MEQTGQARQELVEHFFRHEYGRLVAALTRSFGVDRLAMIEDAVQTALMTALTSWNLSGVPREPGAWLAQVARHRLLDELRRSRTADRIYALDSASRVETDTPAEPPFVDEISDSVLRMLFVCCDDRLARESRLVLALKVICGFGTREIALRLMMTEANVQKRLSRARERLADLWRAGAADIDTPAREQLDRRLESVLETIYLLFTGGYSSAQPDQLVRRELCVEALRLGQLTVGHPVGDKPAAWALLALMYMHTARLETRVDGAGGLLLLEEQDRSRWDRRMIHRGLDCLTRSARGDEFTRYHAEAAVLAEHCMAPSYAETRWSEIVSLYETLERLSPSPIHTLNRAIAVGEAEGAPAGLAILLALRPPSWLAGYYLWDATLGELNRRAGHCEEAVGHLRRALEAAPTDAEKALLRRRLEAAQTEIGSSRDF
jgi:RNA polymerase sigma-70 factor (ECF subfamily)